MDKKYRVNNFTLSDVVDKLTACEESVCFLKCWKYWSDSRQQLKRSPDKMESVILQFPSEWFDDHPQATLWAIDNGFVEEVTPVHDWSGLKLEIRDSGWAILRDMSTGMYLLRFCPDTGAVIIEKDASNPVAGNFDRKGRLIITPGE